MRIAWQSGPYWIKQLPGPGPGKFKAITIEQHTHYSLLYLPPMRNCLRQFLTSMGFPDMVLLAKGSNYFWMMVQHCDKNVSFQQSVLKAMKAVLSKRCANPQSFAYLKDKVSINIGRKQIYGTQVTYDTYSCHAILKPLENRLNVDKRRAEIGLKTIESCLNLMSLAHFEMNKPVYEKKGIHRPKLIPEPKQ